MCKKLFSIILILSFLCCLYSCGNDVDEPPSEIQSQDITQEPVAYFANAGKCSDNSIYDLAENKAHMDNNKNALPCYKLESVSDLNSFCEKFSSKFDFSQSASILPSFDSLKKDFTESFFKDNTIILIYAPCDESVLNFIQNDASIENGLLNVTIKQTENKGEDTSVRGWFIATKISKKTSFSDFTATLTK